MSLRLELGAGSQAPGDLEDKVARQFYDKRKLDAAGSILGRTTVFLWCGYPRLDAVIQSR